MKLEKDRRRRYETANELAADVRRYLTRAGGGGPPSAWPAAGITPGGIERCSRPAWWGRRW